MSEDIFFLGVNKSINSQITIGKIIKGLIENKDYFKKTNITEISIDYKICKKTIKKYLKSYFYKIKGKNEKRLFIKDNVEIQFFKDLEKINLKYNGYIDNSTIKKGQYYLNNIRQ